MSSNDELKDFTREELYSIVNQLKRENECLKTDLIRFKFLSNSYQKLFDKIDEQIVFNNDFLDLKNNIKVLNDFNKSKYFPKIVCIKLNKIDLQSINGLNTKSQTNVNKTNEELIQTNFNENNLSDYEISDNHSEGIDCDNNDIIESNDETIDGSIDEYKNQLSVDCSENLVKIKRKTNENSMEISFETIVKNEIQTEDNSTKVLNLSQIEISNIRSLRNRNSIQTNYNTISGESEDSDNDVNYDSNEEQMSDNSDDIWNEYNLIDNKNVRKTIKDCDSALANHKKWRHRTNDYKVIEKTRKDLKNYTKDLFYCDYKDCSAVFKYDYTLKRHKNIHLAKFMCDVECCNFRAASDSHLKKHMETKHSNIKPFECSVEGCDQSFKAKSYLKRHQQINHKLFICDTIECNLEFNSNNDLDKHMITHLPLDVTTNRDKSDITPNQENTDIIENNNCVENTEFICDWIGCDMKFNSGFRLFTHKLKHTSKTVEKSFTCQWEGCSKVVNKRRYKEHMAVHKGIHTCDWDRCQYRARSERELIIHKKTHSEDYPFICDFNECQKKFKTEMNLKNHQLSQHPKQLEHISWIKCTESGCDFTTKSNNSFLKHKTQHTLPFRCTHCPKGFRRNKSLVSHMAIHTGSTEHKWKCEWYECDKMFSKRCAMLDHMNVHTAAKSYPCEWPGCDKTYILKKTLRQHMDRTHKGLGSYKCKLCEYHTTNTIRYKNHMKKHQNSKS